MRSFAFYLRDRWFKNSISPFADGWPLADQPLTKTYQPISQREAFFLREGLCQQNMWKLTAMR